MRSGAGGDWGRDPDAFEVFYREHVDALERFISRRVSDREMVADLTADVFVAAIEAAGSYRPSQGAPGAWLYGIARNVVASRVRRDGRERRATARVRGREALDPDDIARIDQRLAAQQQSRRLYAAMRRLAASERAVLELVALDDLSIGEAAQALGIRSVTARVRYHRARRQMARASAGRRRASSFGAQLETEGDRMTKQQHDVPLGGCEQRLLSDLRAFVEQRADDRPNGQASAAAGTPRGRPAISIGLRGRGGRRVAAAGTLIAAACAATGALIAAGTTATLAQAFPILSRPETVIPRAGLVSLLQNGGPTLSAARARLDARHARAFGTPVGTGYVVTDRAERVLCVAAPGLRRSSWGAACGSARDVTRNGTGGLLSYDASDPHRVFVVDILPKGATATIREPSGQTRSLQLSDGVLTTIAATPSTITTRIGTHTNTIDLPTWTS
ncbi:MAG TPA: sigma-70 family RNA polymerase sigma factor [Solirubrobacteraceae bacterium]